MKKQKTTKQTVDSIEALKDLPNAVKSTFVDEVGKGLISDLWTQMLGTQEAHKVAARKGDLKPGEEISLKEEKKVQNIEPGINYAREIVHAEKRIHVQSEHETKARIQEILIEIKKLTSSSKELQVQFKEVTMEQVPEGAGKYHTAFVEWILLMIRSARERVDSAVSWTSAMKSKKGQKSYWALYKKHGAINFGLSGERVVATQVG